jgi:hypothetical protein
MTYIINVKKKKEGKSNATTNEKNITYLLPIVLIPFRLRYHTHFQNSLLPVRRYNRRDFGPYLKRWDRLINSFHIKQLK